MSSETIKPKFFVTRPNGSMVALIAMDEVPSTIGFENVSRSLTPLDIAGMTNIGVFESRHLQHVVKAPVTNSTLTDRSLMASKFASAEFEQHLISPGLTASAYGGPPKAFGIHEQAPSPQDSSPDAFEMPSSPAYRIDRNAFPHANSSGQPKASAQQPLPLWKDTSALPASLKCAPGVKEFCSYWLRHGECDYAQQGCLYRHEMPLDRPTLQRLGLRDIPRWYRERHGLGSYLAASATFGGAAAEVGAKKSDSKQESMARDWRHGRRSSQGGERDLHSSVTGLGIKMGDVSGTGNNMKSVYKALVRGSEGCPGTPTVGANTSVPARSFYTNIGSSKPKDQDKNVSIPPTMTLQDLENRQTILRDQEKEAIRLQMHAEASGSRVVDDLPSPAMAVDLTSSDGASGRTTPEEDTDAETPATSPEISDNDPLLDSPIPAFTTVKPLIVDGKAMSLLQPHSPSKPISKLTRSNQAQQDIQLRAIQPKRSIAIKATARSSTNSTNTSTNDKAKIKSKKPRDWERRRERRLAAAANEDDSESGEKGEGEETGKMSMREAYDHDD